MKKYNLLWKIWRKSNFFLISPHFWWDCFFRIENFSKNFVYNSQFFFHQRVYKKLNYKYTKFGIPTLTTHRTTSDQTLVVLIPPPPGLFRVNSVSAYWTTYPPLVHSIVSFYSNGMYWYVRIWTLPWQFDVTKHNTYQHIATWTKKQWTALVTVFTYQYRWLIILWGFY